MTTPHSERGCLRGCVEPGGHFASCESYGAADGKCQGCAPAETRRGALICDICYRRIKGLLRDLPDLVGRMRSLADPARAAVFDRVRVSSSSTVAPAPIADDLVDALHAVEQVMDVWLAYDRDLDWIAAHEHAATWLGQHVLDSHVEVDGIRGGWSVLDAIRQWGVERRDRQADPLTAATQRTSSDRTLSRFTDRESDEHVIARAPVTEWYDPLLPLKDAAERAEVSQSQLRRWVQSKVLTPATTSRDARGTVTRWFYASAVDAAAETMKARRHAGVALEPIAQE